MFIIRLSCGMMRDSTNINDFIVKVYSAHKNNETYLVFIQTYGLFQ